MIDVFLKKKRRDVCKYKLNQFILWVIVISWLTDELFFKSKVSKVNKL